MPLFQTWLVPADDPHVPAYRRLLAYIAASHAQGQFINCAVDSNISTIESSEHLVAPTIILNLLEDAGAGFSEQMQRPYLRSKCLPDSQSRLEVGGFAGFD